MKNFTKLYTDQYFQNRMKNDYARLKSFKQEKTFIQRNLAIISGLPSSTDIQLNGTVCDVGCATGEFLDAIGWNGPKFGMEINENAKLISQGSGISFKQDILNTKEFFDVVIFRGTIQHLPEPFLYISEAWKSLKKDGLVVFLQTPNANSPVYKLFNTLPVLSPSLNFYIPDLTPDLHTA